MNISKTSRAIAALDFQGEAAALENISLEIREIEAASERGRKRSMEIGRTLVELRAGEHDGDAAAGALREGGDIATLARTEADLLAEREGVNAGLRRLGQNREQQRQAQREIQEQSRVKLMGAFDGILGEMTDEARRLAAELGQIFADAQSIQAACGHTGATRLASTLMKAIDELACADMVERKPISASPPLADLLTSNQISVTLAGGNLRLRHRTLRM